MLLRPLRSRGMGIAFPHICDVGLPGWDRCAVGETSSWSLSRGAEQWRPFFRNRLALQVLSPQLLASGTPGETTRAPSWVTFANNDVESLD